jgi:hypothetical protein
MKARLAPGAGKIGAERGEGAASIMTQALPKRVLTWIGTTSAPACEGGPRLQRCQALDVRFARKQAIGAAARPTPASA